MLSQTQVATIVTTIVNKQRLIIGPLALERARTIPGISADTAGRIRIDPTINDAKQLLKDLVGSYEELFGQTSVEVCKEAVKDVHGQIPEKDLPDVLR